MLLSSGSPVRECARKGDLGLGDVGPVIGGTSSISRSLLLAGVVLLSMMGALLAVPVDVPECGLSGRAGGGDSSCGLCILRVGPEGEVGETGRGSRFGVEEAAREIAGE